MPNPQKVDSGTEGQDRKSYSDDQDRDSYTVKESAEAKHTPGPWEVRHTASGWNIGDKSGNTSFASVRDHFANGEADARLIAAAPDAYEILSFLAEFVKEGADSVSFSALMDDKGRTLRVKIGTYMHKVAEGVR